MPPKVKKVEKIVDIESETPSDTASETPSDTASDTASETPSETPSDTASEVTEDGEEYKIIRVEIPEMKDPSKSIFLHDSEPELSYSIEYPRMQYGFQHFIHQTKDKTTKFKEFENKKKVYLVINPFERYIDNSEESIGAISKKFFYDDLSEKDSKPGILSRAFYKLWELLIEYPLIDPEQKDFTSAHLAEGPGSFIQATMFFREMYSKNYKSDKYHAITLHSTSATVPEFEKKFSEYYEKEKPQRFFQHKTYPKEIAGGDSKKDNGDLTDPKTTKLFGGSVREKVDFVTADGGFEWEHSENLQEQESYKLIIGEIVNAINILKKGGNFVCKIYETFTMTSMKILSCLREMFDKIHIVKPLTSRQSNSEKYVVCIGFKNDSKHISVFNEIQKTLHEYASSSDINLVNLFPTFKLDKTFLEEMIKINIEIANKQFKSINKMIKFINDKNYYGDVYQMHRQMQINAAKYWTDKYLKKKL